MIHVSSFYVTYSQTSRSYVVGGTDPELERRHKQSAKEQDWPLSEVYASPYKFFEDWEADKSMDRIYELSEMVTVTRMFRGSR